MKIKAAIFDLDGTLIDSLDVWEKIDVEFTKNRNLTVPDSYGEAIRSMSFYETAVYTIDTFQLPDTPEQLMDEWNAMALEAYSRHVPLKPNVQEFLEYLKEKDIRLGVATNLSRSLYEPALKNLEIYHLFDAFTSILEVERSKAYPDIYLLTAKKLAVKPASCIVFEDVLAGIQGGKKAGMKTCGVYDFYGKSEQKEIQKQADDYIYDFKEWIEKDYI